MSGKNGTNLVSKFESVILLLDSSLEFQDYEKIVEENNIKIITLDFKTHNILKEKKIAHNISDAYLNRNEMEDIQSRTYDYARWHENEKMEKYITYEGINLGLLIQTEFNYFLVPFLKKFVEIKKIVEENKNANFIVSTTIEKIIKKFSGKILIVITFLLLFGFYIAYLIYNNYEKFMI